MRDDLALAVLAPSFNATIEDKGGKDDAGFPRSALLRKLLG
jgi:hypothetical protein